MWKARFMASSCSLLSISPVSLSEATLDHFPPTLVLVVTQIIFVGRGWLTKVPGTADRPSTPLKPQSTQAFSAWLGPPGLLQKFLIPRGRLELRKEHVFPPAATGFYKCHIIVFISLLL